MDDMSPAPVLRVAALAALAALAPVHLHAQARELDAVYRDAARLPLLTSLLVARNGTLVREQYFHGLRAGQPVNIKSASKSILSALVGIAIAEGEFGEQSRLADLLPDYFRGINDPAKRALTVRNLLTMQAGLRGTSFDNYGEWVNSRNWVGYALNQPFDCAPDTCMVYSTGNSHMLSVILTKQTGMSTRAYAQRKLFTPLGMQLRGWARDPQGYDFGGNEMFFTPRDMLKFGEFYRRRGRLANGRQLLPETWIERAWGEYATSPWNGHRYGYHWWTRETPDGVKVHFAWGYGGQFIFVIPARQLVVVATASLNRGRDGRHLRSVHDLVDTVIAAYPPR
jgi:CubicO group peptidase (beta-lactamase class C family)